MIEATLASNPINSKQIENLTYLLILGGGGRCVLVLGYVLLGVLVGGFDLLGYYFPSMSLAVIEKPACMHAQHVGIFSLFLCLVFRKISRYRK